jgi:hypothetical protein
VLLAALLAFSMAAPASALLCRTRKGAVVSRTKCKKKETALDPAAIGGVLQGAAGPGGTAQPRVRLADVTGRRLPGILNSDGDYLHPFSGGVVRVGVTPDGFVDTHGFGYESANCTGPPLVFAGPGASFLTVPVRGRTLFVPGDGASERMLHSTDFFPESPSDCTGSGRVFDAATGICCVTVMQARVVAPAVAVDLHGFQPPFHVEVEE